MCKYTLLICFHVLLWKAVLPAQNITYYVPNPVQVPSLSEGKQGNVLAGFSWSNGYTGYNLMGMYSPRKNLLLILNHNGRSGRVFQKIKQYATNFHLTEIGVGAYHVDRDYISSAMAGYGQEKLFSSYNNKLAQTSTLHLQRYFLQGAYSYVNSVSTIGVGIRFLLIRYTQGLISSDLEQEYLRELKKIEQKSPVFVPELAFHVGIVRYHPIVISMHLTTHLPSVNKLKIQESSFGMSIGYQFGRKKTQME